MPRKGQPSDKEVRLARLIHAEEYLTLFLKRMSSPTKRFDEVEKALAQVSREKLLLWTEVKDDVPAIRLGK